MPSSPASLTLTQTKLVAGTVYAVRSTVTTATPSLLLAPFLLVGELFTRLATLEELQGGAFALDELTAFVDTVTDPTVGAVLGDTLRILTPPELWDDSAPSYMDFTIEAIEGSRLVVSPPFPAMASALSWETRNGAGVISSGMHAATNRYGVSLATSRVSTFTAQFADPITATQHLEAVQAYTDALVLSAASDADTFRNAAPGNPVITNLPR